jgi:RNA polymerase-binding transcription factor DksA
MPDAMDQLQAFNDDHTADALRRHADRVVAVGRSHCAIADCREPISDARRDLGAQLCLACQHEAEARSAHFSQWMRR